ncbi:MAG: DNA polymerase IV [Candidatus Neomarinimicrobiota bacterium]
MENSDSQKNPRAIAHFDLDAFFCSVEVLKNPELAGKPIVVGGKAEERGVVAAASYPAREFGIHSAMSMYRAQKLCADLIVVPPHFKLYKTYSRVVMGILRSATPVVQQVSVDEAYLDLTDRIESWSAAETITRGLQNRIGRDIGLSVSVGLGSNKMIAKIGSDFEKPHGFTVVSPGREQRFLAPLAVNVIPGIGPKTAEKLASMNVHLIRELAELPERVLTARFGKWGREMFYWARGCDERPVAEEHDTKSVSTERTFNTDINDEAELVRIIEKLSAQVEEQLIKEGLAGRTIAIKVRYSDFETFTRQVSLARVTNAGDLIGETAVKLFRKSWNRGRPLRLLGVGVSNFDTPGGQLELNI